MKEARHVTRGPEWTGGRPFELQHEHALNARATRPTQNGLDGRIDRFHDAEPHGIRFEHAAVRGKQRFKLRTPLTSSRRFEPRTVRQPRNRSERLPRPCAGITTPERKTPGGARHRARRPRVAAREICRKTILARGITSATTLTYGRCRSVQTASTAARWRASSRVVSNARRLASLRSFRKPTTSPRTRRGGRRPNSPRDARPRGWWASIDSPGRSAGGTSPSGAHEDRQNRPAPSESRSDDVWYRGCAGFEPLFICFAPLAGSGA